MLFKKKLSSGVEFYEINRQHNNFVALLRLAVVILFGFITAYLILLGRKTSIGLIFITFSLFFFAALTFKKGDIKAGIYALYFIVITIPFPYYIQFLGRDALTITTLLIFFIFFIFLLRYLVRPKYIRMQSKFAYIFPGLILISFTISLILNPTFIEQSIKFYAANISGIFLYFLILVLIKERRENTILIKIIIFSLAVQSVILLFQNIFPEIMNKFIVIFQAREYVPYLSLTDSYILRPKGTIKDFELLAEWLLIGSILSIYLIYTTKKKIIFVITLFLCMSGIIFTKTRSCLMLLVSAIFLITFLINLLRKEKKAISIMIILLTAFGILILALIMPDQIGANIERFGKYFLHRDLMSSRAINREVVWSNAINIFLRNIKLFGNGLYLVETTGYKGALSFHSLYLTLLFKIGILGLILHVLFWLKLIKKSCVVLISKVNIERWYDIFFLLIATLFMLIDQIKIEYLRYSHTIQFAWIIYALLVISWNAKGKSYENIVVSKNSN